MHYFLVTGVVVIRGPKIDPRLNCERKSGFSMGWLFIIQCLAMS